MSWLIITILAYFFLAVISLFDRYFLAGPIPNPKVYTFYVGILYFCFGLFLMPSGITLLEMSLLEMSLIVLGLGAGMVRIFAILFLAESIVRSEISRVIPAIGGFLPIFSFFFFLFISPPQEILNPFHIITFALLVSGSILISSKRISLKTNFLNGLKYPVLAALLFALTYFLSKLLFLKTTFLTGGFLILLGHGLGITIFLILPRIRKLIFFPKIAKKTFGLLLLGQIIGILGMIFFYYALFLAKPFQAPLINALGGISFVFLLFFVFLLSIWKPWILKEEMKGAILFQKFLAVLLIGVGLVILAFS